MIVLILDISQEGKGFTVHFPPPPPERGKLNRRILEHFACWYHRTFKISCCGRQHHVLVVNVLNKYNNNSIQRDKRCGQLQTRAPA